MNTNIVHGLSFLIGFMVCNLIWMVYYNVGLTTIAWSAFALVCVSVMLIARKYVEIQGRN
jgi:hypothetical protein